jgi:hypothetical protein
VTPLVPKPVATTRVSPPQPVANVLPGSLEPPDPLGLDSPPAVHVVDANEAPVRTPGGGTARAQAQPPAAKPAATALATAAPMPASAGETDGNDAQPAEQASAATFTVVLAKADSEGEARAQLSPLTKKYGSLLGARRLSYHREKSGGAYVWQVRTSGLSESDAQTLCERITAAGGDCSASPQ